MALRRVPDLDSLVLLLDVAATGSLGRAGTTHGISQPAVSARIRNMERLVGVPLVERGARGSSLTPTGILVAGWARAVLEAAEILDAGIASLRLDSESHLRVAASMTIAEHLLPRWLVRLAADRPQTAVSLAAMNSTQVEQTVLAGHADLGFVEGPDIADELDTQVVAHDRLIVVVAPSHPWASRRRRITAAELAGTRLVQREPTSGTRTSMESALSAHKPMATPILELSTASAVRSAVAAGAGPAVLSELAIGDDIDNGRLVAITIPGLDLTRRLRAVWPRGQRPHAPARDLLTIAMRSPLRPTRRHGPDTRPTAPLNR